jgi:tricorn protease-like protein
MRLVRRGPPRSFFLIVVSSAILLFAPGGTSSGLEQTYIVFLCGEGYANLCSVVPETGEHRQLTHDGDARRPGTREYRLYHRGYRGPSLSRDGTLLSFAFEGRPFIARQDAEARVPVGQSEKVGFTSIRPDGRRLALFRRIVVCIGSPETGSCQGYSTLRITTQRGAELRRIARVWEADWASGKRLVASRGSDHFLLFAGPDLRKKRVLIEWRNHLLSEPAVSPDGRFVAAKIVTQHRHFIGVFSLASGKYVRRLTSGPRDSNPGWSPDGRQIVFSRNAGACLPPSPCGELFVAPSDRRGEPRSLGVEGVQPTWSVRRDS